MRKIIFIGEKLCPECAFHGSNYKTDTVSPQDSTKALGACESFCTLIYQINKLEINHLTELVRLRKRSSDKHIILCAKEINREYKPLLHELGLQYRSRTAELCCVCTDDIELYQLARQSLANILEGIPLPCSLTMRALQVLLRNISEPNLQKISFELMISPDHLSRLIKRETGFSFRRLVNKLKLSVARELLLAKSVDLIEVAMRLGYSELSNFNRFLKNH